MPIRLALVIPTLDQGGAEKQLCLLAQGLPRDEFSTHVVLLTRDGPLRPTLEAAGIPVTVVGKRFRADPTAYFRLRKTLAAIRPDVVHTWLFAANAYGRAAARSIGTPVVLGSERCVDPWKSAAHFLIDRHLANKTQGLTTNSAGVRDFYAAQGIDGDRFTIIPNGVPAREAPAIAREQAFARLGVDPRRRLILAVGRLWPQKGYRDLIWAAELLATARGDTTLVIIGSGPQEGELLRHRDAVSRLEHVRFAGHRDDVASLLPHADVFWNGSHYEGQSNALIEAMQAGRPVVVSDIAGNRDLVRDGETGRIVPSGDRADFARKTYQLLDDPRAAESLGLAARRQIEEQFTVDAMVHRHAVLYRQLLANGG